MTTRTTTGERRVPWGTIIAVAIGVAVVVGASVLMVRGQSQGASALDLVKEQTQAGLARERARLEERGESLEVVWTTTPMPRGDGDTVTGRLEARPSGASAQALFMVMGEQVTYGNDLARRLVSGPEEDGSGEQTKMDDGMQMPVP